MRVVAEVESYRVKCPYCLSVTEFQREDIHDHLHVGPLHFQGIKCSVCHNSICVASRDSAGAPNQLKECVEAVYKESTDI